MKAPALSRRDKSVTFGILYLTFFLDNVLLTVVDKSVTFGILYLTFFLDNLLLTVVVPIIPDYLHANSLQLLAETGSPLINYAASVELETQQHTSGIISRLNDSRGVSWRPDAGSKVDEDSSRATEMEMEAEEVSVGVLLSLKALVQLVFNPLVGAWSARVGYRLPVLAGSLGLLVASLLFAWGGSFWWLALGRAVQGAGSASLGVAGMCLAAELFAHDAARSRAMGVLLGSVALGVLVGYPFGGVTYALADKAAPFLIIAFCVLLDILLQLMFLDLTVNERDHEWCATECDERFESASVGGAAGGGVSLWTSLLEDAPTAAALTAIFSSTCAMAVLEPCLPIWLMTNFKPEKWQLGTVFVPDSLGYLVATNALGGTARALGRARVAVCAVTILGLSACTIPAMRSVRALLVPHALLGLALGAADAALVPALAERVAARAAATSALFSLHQTAVSAAYFIAPLLGGEMTHTLGFTWCLRLVGGANLLCAARLYVVFRRHGLDSHLQDNWQHLEDSSSETTGDGGGGGGGERLALTARSTTR